MSLDRDHRVLLRQIMSVIGVASLASCSARTVSDGAEGADTQPSTEGPSESESESQSEADTEAEADTNSDGWSPDHPSADTDDSDTDPTDTDTDTDDTDTDTDTDTGGDMCGPFVSPWRIASEPPPECDPPPDAWGSAPVCFYPPDGTSCAEEPQMYECIIGAYECGLITGGDSIHCGPYTTVEGACCYVVAGDCAVGRPFTVAGRARVAALVAGRAWAAAPTPDLAGLDLATRAALADAWAQSGQSEHASIASFARFTTQLLGLGAPARLIAASLRAGADERRHALRCTGLANAYATTPSQPAALDITAALTAADPVAIAVSLASEACVAETVSLMLLIAARDQSTDPAVRACLAEMIADERRHLLLGWEALAWMTRQFGRSVRAAVANVFAQAEQHVGFGATSERIGEVASMRAHGYLPVEDRRTIAIAALRELVLPSARALQHSTESVVSRAD